MRIKIYFDLIDKPNTYERIPNNQVHGFLNHRLKNTYAKESHVKGHLCLLTFSSPKIEYDKDRLAFIFSGPDDMAEELIISLRTSPLARIGKYSCQLHDIREIEPVDTSLGKVLLRGRVLMSNSDRSQPIRDISQAETLLANVSENKLKKMGINERLTFDVFRIDETTSYYAKKGPEDIHFPASHIVTSVSGSPEALDALLTFGAGQNTGSGNGMLWEVS